MQLIKEIIFQLFPLLIISILCNKIEYFKEKDFVNYITDFKNILINKIERRSDIESSVYNCEFY